MTYNVTVMKDQKATGIRRKYDDEFKRNALKMIEQGQSVRSVSQALGVAEGQLHHWRRAASPGRLERSQPLYRGRIKELSGKGYVQNSWRCQKFLLSLCEAGRSQRPADADAPGSSGSFL